MNRTTLVAVMLVVAAPAAAQETASAGLRPKGLPTVFIEDDRGAETRGKLLRLDQQSVTVLVEDQARTFELSSVRKVQKRGDSLKNGTIIGAVFGAVTGIVMGGFSDCPGANSGANFECTAGARAAIALVSTGVYAAIGAGIDAAIQGRTTLYQRPVSLARASGPGAAARFSVSW